MSMLSEVIGEALKIQFEQEKQKQLAQLANVIPRFVPSQFVKALIYHVLFLMVLGPMSSVFLICFESLAFLKNCGFLPAKISLMFFIA